MTGAGQGCELAAVQAAVPHRSQASALSILTFTTSPARQARLDLTGATPSTPGASPRLRPLAAPAPRARLTSGSAGA